MPNTDKLVIELDELYRRLQKALSPNYDLVIAIARGGILPGYLASRYLDIPLEIMHLEFRDDRHQPKHQNPRLTKPFEVDTTDRRILLCDDVSNSGATLNAAKKQLNADLITALVISGTGDISLYGPHDRCIQWPWD